MTDPESLRKRLKKASAESATRTDELLDGELQALSQLTKVDLDQLAPKLTGACEELLAAVRESTAKNESVAGFKERLSKLGPAAATLGRAVIKLVKGA
jgi:hypothetical protein